jgi:hypothetical protein
MSEFHTGWLSTEALRFFVVTLKLNRKISSEEVRRYGK